MAEEKKKPTSGRKSDQKMKPYLVYDYLMRQSDANHVVTAAEIVGYLQECGIQAERRSIYKDIEEIEVSFSDIEVNLLRFENYDFWTKVKSKFL